MSTESIRLDSKDSAKWFIKDKGLTPMSEMCDEHIQKAIIITQKRQMKSLRQLELDERLESQLRQEAKNRNLIVEGLETIGNNLEKKYHESKQILDGVFATVKRRKKKLTLSQA